MEETKKQCSKCRGEIDKLAKKCLHCGSDLRSWFARHPILTGILALFLFSFIVTFFRSVNESVQKAKTISATSTLATSPTSTAQKKAEPSDFVEITKVEVVENSIGTPDLNVTFKNKSKKTIDALDMEGYVFNAYDEPAERIGDDNRFLARIQEKITPGQSYSASFNLFSYKFAKKIKLPLVTRLHFTDGETIE